MSWLIIYLTLGFISCVYWTIHYGMIPILLFIFAMCIWPIGWVAEFYDWYYMRKIK